MRIAFSLAALFLLVPSHAVADRVVWMEFLNSDLTFGSVAPDQRGYDLSSQSVSRKPQADAWDGWGTTYHASSGPLVEQTLVRDGSGAVVGSQYLYAGGTFRIDFTLVKDDESRTGSFVAPIVDLTVAVDERFPFDSSVMAQYLLGPGLFDASIASALGIRRRTAGGDIRSDLLLIDGGRTSPVRTAWDGVADVTLDVAEPPMALLSVLGLGAAWLWRRRAYR